MDRLTEVLHSGLLFCQGILFFECFWWFPSYFGNDEETSSLKGLEIVQTYKWFDYQSHLADCGVHLVYEFVVVRLFHCMSESCVCWGCYPGPCCLFMSYVVFGFLWIVFWTSWRCADDNSWKQLLWTSSVDQNGSITWKAFTGSCVLWTNLYPNHAKPTYLYMSVLLSCICSVDVGEIGLFLHTGW